MKKLVLMIIPALICGVLFSSCDSNKAEPKEEIIAGELQYVKTELGGCNSTKSTLKSDESESETKDDELIITVMEESIHVFVGLNYICCAPFETKIETKDDVLHMYIIDICNLEVDECYCRCMCYYTFDFVFNYQGKVNQKYKVLLIDPRIEQEPVVFSEGTIVGNE